VKEGRLIRHRGCHCVEGQWTYDRGEREQRRRVELWWRGALAREEAKWRHGGEWPRLRWSFYISGGWELGGSRRVACGGDANSMLQFWFERGGDMTKHSWKIKRRQRARLGSMGRKCDTVRSCDDVGRSRCSTKEGKGRRRCQLGWRESYWVKK
jgi:hypothetical protein